MGKDIDILRESIVEGKYHLYNQELKKCVKNVINDYKEVLKENEELLEVKVSASAHNRILELEKEIKELEEKYDKDTHTLQNQLDIANADRVEKDKIIKLMTKYIADEDTTEIFCVDDENKICDDEECKKCVIRFFEEKVRNKYE